MGGESPHALTSPKGGTALAILLTMAGVFINLQSAKWIGMVAALLILWLYSDEIRACWGKRAPLRILVAPALAITFVGILVVGSTLAVNSRPANAPANSLTLNDIQRVVHDAVQGQDPKPSSLTPESHPLPPIVIQEPPEIRFPSDTARSAPATPVHSLKDDGDPVVQNLKKTIKRSEAGKKEWLDCLGEQTKITLGLNKLINSAIEMQNAFYFGKNDKKIANDLNTWTKDVKEYFSTNSIISSKYQMFELASEGQDYRGFLDAHATGKRAWAQMDAKVKALEAIQKEWAASQRCEDIKNAAVVKCVESGACA